MPSKASSHREIAILTVFFLAAHGLMLFNGGRFWDDWMHVGKKFSVLKDLFVTQFGLWGYPMALTSQDFLPMGQMALLLRSLTLLSFGGAALCLHQVLGSIRGITREDRLFLTLFFALLPVNSAKICLCIAQYSLTYFLFYLGLWLVSKSLNPSRLPLRALALLLFFVSFTTNSIILFYLVVPLYIAYREGVNFRRPADWGRLGLKYLDFFLLPFVFFLAMKIFMQPAPEFSSYNQITPVGFLVQGPLGSLVSLKLSFLDVIDFSLRNFGSVPLLLSLALIYGLRRLLADGERTENAASLRLFFLLGLFLFLLAAYPYAVVGITPKLTEFDNRHQMLVPLGAAFMAYYGLRLVCRFLRAGRQVFTFLSALLISLFCLSTVNDYIGYQRDWYKQLALIEAVKGDPTIRSAGVVVFDDLIPEWNAKERSIQYDNYSGLLETAFGDQTRFGEGFDYFSRHHKINRVNPRWARIYNVGDYVPAASYVVATIDSRFRFYDRRVLRLMYYQLFNTPKFDDEIRKILFLRVEGPFPLEPA